jgi:tryptophan synthase alpha chain
VATRTLRWCFALTRNGIAEALGANRRNGRGSLLVYLMIDVRRRAALGPLVSACRRAGVTGIELGFPFSDPIADGPVLQAAAARSIHNGTQWRDLLAALRVTSKEMPTAVMTYANPVLHRGLRKACDEMAASGGSGLIVPDLALEESGPWQVAARRAGLSLVQMGSPAASVARIRELAESTSGFLYLVSRFGTTGRGSRGSRAKLRTLVSAAHEARPELPVLVGFGVRTAADFIPVRATGADGAIVGTAVEELLTRSVRPARLEHFLGPLVRASRTGSSLR